MFKKYYRGKQNTVKYQFFWYGQIDIKSPGENATSIHKIKNKKKKQSREQIIQLRLKAPYLFFTRSFLSWQSYIMGELMK